MDAHRHAHFDLKKGMTKSTGRSQTAVSMVVIEGNGSQYSREPVSLQIAFFHLLHGVIASARGQRHVGQRRIHAR
jgi:hypothetical protein